MGKHYEMTPGAILDSANTWQGNQTFADDVLLALGTGSTSRFSWDTTDPNANALLLQMPPGGSVDVPVLAIGQSIESVNLGLFDTVVNPKIALFGIGAVTTGCTWDFRKARGSIGTPTAITSGDDLGTISAFGYSGAGGYVEACRILFDSEGTVATGRLPGKIVFSTATDATTSVLTAALTLNSAQLATFGGAVAINGKGTLGWTSTAATAGEDGFKVTTTDSVVQSAGMVRSIVVSHTVTGAKTGSADQEGVSSDMFLNANTQYAYALAGYIADSGNKNHDFSAGATVYIENLGSGTIGNVIGVDIGINSTNLAAGRHTGIRIRNHSGTAKSAIDFESAFTYGLDFSNGQTAAAIATAEFHLSNGATIDNINSGVLIHTATSVRIAGAFDHNPATLSGTPATTGCWFDQAAQTFTDNATAQSGTAAKMVFNAFQQPTLAATNLTVTTTEVVNLYVAAPVQGTNETFTAAYAAEFAGVTNAAQYHALKLSTGGTSAVILARFYQGTTERGSIQFTDNNSVSVVGVAYARLIGTAGGQTDSIICGGGIALNIGGAAMLTLTGSKVFKSDSATPIGISVTNAGTVGTLGMLVIPVKADTGEPNDAAMGNQPGCIAYNSYDNVLLVRDTTTDNPLSVAVAGYQIQTKVPALAGGYYHPKQYWPTPTDKDARQMVDETICPECGEPILAGEDAPAVAWWPNGLYPVGLSGRQAVHAIAGHLHLEKDAVIQELRAKIKALERRN